VVFDSPYLAVPASRHRQWGIFRLMKIPAGTWTVAVWHPVLASAQKTLTVRIKADETLELPIRFNPPPAGPGPLQRRGVAANLPDLRGPEVLPHEPARVPDEVNRLAVAYAEGRGVHLPPQLAPGHHRPQGRAVEQPEELRRPQPPYINGPLRHAC